MGTALLHHVCHGESGYHVPIPIQKQHVAECRCAYHLVETSQAIWYGKRFLVADTQRSGLSCEYSTTQSWEAIQRRGF